MSVHAKAHFISIVVIDTIEMLQEQVADHVHGTVGAAIVTQVCLVNDKVARVFPGLLKVLLRSYLELYFGQLESDRLDLGYDGFAGLVDEAEGCLLLAFQVGNGLLPLMRQLLEDSRRDGELRVAGVNDCGVTFAQVREVAAVVQHSLTQQSPRFELRRIILERLQP